ncbi:hypothetical protein VTK73DRAFT_1252 [Phialemonium thermophilum]|uniref:C2H2-type domain-containing protein n=1 Tax=Phialemonium thermophilum TaxID=223376 RepID=A0ABR3Y4L2_9PEZI
MGDYQTMNSLSHDGITKLLDSENFGLAYSLGDTSLPAGDSCFSAPGASKPLGGSAHEDSCVDGCSLGVHYNASQSLITRGVSASFHQRVRHSVSDLEFTYLHPQSLDLGLGSQRATFKDTMDSSASAQLQDNGEWGFVFDNPLTMVDDDGPSGRDEDSLSLAPSTTTCDSACRLDNRCTGIACANTEDACTDRNCPDTTGRVPSEVAKAAAALTSIGGGPPAQQQDPFQIPSSVGMLPMGLPTPHSEFGHNHPPLFLPDRLKGITSHLLWAHSDPSSSSCTRPCPIDDPHVFGHCQFPYSLMPEYSHMPDAMSLYSYDLVHPSFRPGVGLEECGAEIMSPDEFIQHFNTQHRHELESAMLLDFTNDQRLPSTAPSVGSSGNFFDTSLVSPTSSLKELSPLTPLSTPHETGEGDAACTRHQRSSSNTSLSDKHIGAGSENRCLWCDEVGSEVCGLCFSTPSELFSHVNSAHIKHLTKGPKGFRCGWENCRREDDGKDGFPQRSKIERHMQTHIEHKPHSCEHCGKKFSAKQALKQHLLIHTNEKPLACDWPGCGKTFRQQSALTMHKRVHTGEKPLSCDICGRTFSESSNLSKHKRTHEIKGRFTCTHPGCNRDFHRQDQLRRHMKLHAEKSGAELSDDSRADETADEFPDPIQSRAVPFEAAEGARSRKTLSHTPPPGERDERPSRKKRSC